MTSKRYQKEMLGEEGGFQKKAALPEEIVRRREKNRRRREESEARRFGRDEETKALSKLRECGACHIKAEEVEDYQITGLKCRLRAVTRVAELPLCPDCYKGVNQRRVDVVGILGENVFQVVGRVEALPMTRVVRVASECVEPIVGIGQMINNNPRLDKYRP